MMIKKAKIFLKSILPREGWLLIFFILISVIAFSVLAFPIALRPALFTLKQGDVSQQDILAPYTLNYQSQILTKQAQEDAVRKVQPVYLMPDPAITREQIENLLNSLNFITTVRQDNNSATTQKFTDLSSMKFINIDTTLAIKLLDFTDNQWQIIQNEAVRVLGDALRSSIREDQIERARQNIPSLIGYSIPEDLAEIIPQIVSPFIRANSLYSEEQTRLAQEQSFTNTEPVVRTYIAGEIIVRRGQIISETTMEALNQYGFIKPDDTSREILAGFILVLSTSVLAFLYFYFRRPPLLKNNRGVVLFGSLFLLFLVSSRFIIPNRTVVPYLFPLAAFGLSITSLFGIELGLVFSSLLIILASYGLSGGSELIVYFLLITFSGSLVLGKGYRIIQFLWASLVMTAAGVAVILAFRLPNAITDWIGIVTLIGAAAIHGFSSSAVALGIQSIFAHFMGQVTGLQLMELARPDHPLLKYLLQNAPGTYQHSLQVANLAEQAAEMIGADPMLTRVGAIYHDVGKVDDPSFFIENQVPGKLDTHDTLPPDYSARKIIKHITDGIILGKKYRLPQRIIDFIAQHHGTLLTRYQYSRALHKYENQPDLVNKDDFRYPGPRPQSRETAILMLADGCEARARADFPENDEQLRSMINSSIDYYRSEGQLDDTPLTMRDLHRISDSFYRTLKNTYHPRIQYPEYPNKNGKDIETVEDNHN